MSTVSVVIPCYNGSDLLPGAIESVLTQTRPADEIIVVDDGSQDNTAEVAVRYPGVIVHRIPNGGVSNARNAGARLATSEWIAFLDHDDLFRPHKLEQQMALLAQSPGYDVCVCNRVHRIHSGGLWVDVDIPSESCVPPSEQIGAKLRGTLRFNPSAVVVRRSTLLETGGFDSTAQPCEDWDMWLRLAKVARFLALHSEQMTYRIHGGNTSRNAERMMKAELLAWDRHVRPALPAWQRAPARQAARSRFLAGVALVKRDCHEAHLGIMTRSLAMWPFGELRRYKIYLHMLLRQTGLIR